MNQYIKEGPHIQNCNHNKHFAYPNHQVRKLLYLFMAAVTMCINLLCASDNSAGQHNTEEYITTPFFDDFNTLDTSVWQIATWVEHGGQTAPERCYTSGGFLNMIFINDSDDGFLNAAIQTRKEFLYGTWEVRLKPSSVPGVLNSFYTIDWNNTSDNTSFSNGTKQEIDIEFLTYTFGSSQGKVHFAVHENNKTSFDTNPDIPLNFDPSADFHIWGIEITPKLIRWFVDNTTLQTYLYNKNDIRIDSPYQLKLNVWSQTNWINGPPAADTECLYQIDWVRFTPYK